MHRTVGCAVYSISGVKSRKKGIVYVTFIASIQRFVFEIIATVTVGETLRCEPRRSYFGSFPLTVAFRPPSHRLLLLAVGKLLSDS